ncbi:NifB/NifX family molybdenum-iron cluster-binding protein [Spirochaetota bacterium]
MKELKIAIPSNNPGGLLSEMSGHFGHCDLFTIVDIKEGEVADISLLENLPHVQGGCMAPVNHLSQNGVQILIAGGMGMRPLMGFNSVGIDVYHNDGLNRVNDVISAFKEGRLPKFSTENTCSGGDH